MSEARMQENPQYAPGTFCWVELTTTDGEAAKKFYTALFNWESIDTPIGPDMVYTMLKQDGKEIGALYQMTGEMKGQGIPPNWLSYASVPSVDATVEKAKSLGGEILQEPMDVFEYGRMAVIKDPTNAVFALWQPGSHPGAGITNVPISLCWNELVTRDGAKAGEFYQKLFGWGVDAQEMGPITYTMFTNEGRPAGGMYEPTPEMGDVPPHWMVYFAVPDTDALAKKATELGANVIVPPSDIPGIGRFAIIQDPQGAAFAIIKLEAQV